MIQEELTRLSKEDDDEDEDEDGNENAEKKKPQHQAKEVVAWAEHWWNLVGLAPAVNYYPLLIIILYLHVCRTLCLHHGQAPC